MSADSRSYNKIHRRHGRPAGIAGPTAAGPGRPRVRVGSAARLSTVGPTVGTLGAEEEFHVVDLATRRLAPRAAELLDRLAPEGFTAELHRSVIETNTPVSNSLDDLRQHLVRLRRQVASAAETLGLGIVASGTAPLARPNELGITKQYRYVQMLEDYQLLVREQLICGAQVHVCVPDRNEAVALLPRLAPWLPTLLALSASSPFWMGEDTGYASMRSLLWQRWPTAGPATPVASAAEYDALIANLVASGVITDPGMIYFDVRPSAHVPTLELRLTDACPDVDTVVLLAGMFRALVQRERAALAAGTPLPSTADAVLRAAAWRAARSGLEGQLVEVAGPPRPVPATVAVLRLVRDLRPYLEAEGDWAHVSALADRAVARGSSAAIQRRVFARAGRLTDVVDMLVNQTARAHRPVGDPAA